MAAPVNQPPPLVVPALKRTNTNPNIIFKFKKRKAVNKKGMTLRQIWRNYRYEPDYVNSRYVRLQRIFPVVQGEPALNFKTLTVDPNTTPPRRVHFQRIYPADPEYQGKLIECPRIKITCDCERWTYFWEYACFKKGAADIIMGNGRPPTFLNTRGLPAPCKHLLVSMRYAMKYQL